MSTIYIQPLTVGLCQGICGDYFGTDADYKVCWNCRPHICEPDNYNECIYCGIYITDESYSEVSLYCKHGTFIGDPCGPDYICGLCEIGE